MINANIVIDVFNSAIYCLSVLLDTTVGGWIGGMLILIAVVRLIKGLQKL